MCIVITDLFFYVQKVLYTCCLNVHTRALGITAQQSLLAVKVNDYCVG
jgi:hypothetical protein